MTKIMKICLFFCFPWQLKAPIGLYIVSRNKECETRGSRLYFFLGGGGGGGLCVTL